MKILIRPKLSAFIAPTFLLIFSLLISWYVSRLFLRMHIHEKLIPSPGLTRTIFLSDYAPFLKNTTGDSRIYFYQGKQDGGSVLILGGTHPDEPAGYVTTYLLVENVGVVNGSVWIIPRANNSAFTHNLPQEGMPQFFSIGTRVFRYGARITNSIHQWPDPEIYLHYPSGQKLAGNETRNLNRAYPGRTDGNLTEQIAYAIMQLIEKEKIDIAFDLHEASPEYPVVNAIVSPTKNQDIATEAAMELEFDGLRYSLEQSPYNFRGLSHREWAEFTKTNPFLFETANPIQGRLRGRTDADLLITGRDKMYLQAAKIGVLTVPYDSTGLPLKIRVARHITALIKVLEIYSRYNPDKAIVLSGIPTYEELETNGLEKYFLRKTDHGIRP